MNRTEVETFIHQNFTNIEQDYPWENDPGYTVFRHSDNRKWFALIMQLPYRSLRIDRPERVSVINLKSDPDLIEELLHRPGTFPAYHMSKTHWITLLLDHTADESLIQELINLSYKLTSQKHN